MIFQSLISLYDRLEKQHGFFDKDVPLPPYGFSIEDIGFVVTIDRQGNIVGEPEDLRKKVKSNSYEFRQSVIPFTNRVNVRSSSGAAKVPNFMVDKADYLFGMSGKSKKSVHHSSFKKLVDDVCGESPDDGALAVRAFLSEWKPEDSVELRYWKEVSGKDAKLVAFKLQGDLEFVHERTAVRKLWSDFVKNEKFPRGVSFVDGETHDLQLQYAQFKFGSGASLVSFNEKAYESYGKKKGENAPISVEDEFKSSAALKHLLRSRHQRIRIGDATTVFWAERASPVETFLGQILNPSVEDKGAMESVRKFLEAVRQGVMPNDIEDDREIRFYILGLSLNKARLALRFWHVCSVGELMDRFRNHFNNLEMERNSENDFPFPSIQDVLRETVFGKTLRDKDNKISPVLAGTLTRSILVGARYPQNLFQSVIGRIRADQRINYLRAAILKAVLQRNYNKEVPMSLDTERREVSYLLGRLFAVLEKAQLDALGKVNTTIKDRFFSAASATPASVFPRLLRLSQHHIEKAEYGYVSDRRISKIMEHVDLFPAHMNLQDQGLFAIAYYQQKNALYRKKESKSEGEE
jgi:CRISPR-associated protein Csd1